jgi:two-component system, chemotaxis family, sensor kinase CheA
MNFDSNNSVFKEEAYELLEIMEQSLIDMESSSDKTESINTIFRALHTIKGSGSMYGFSVMASFAHEFESLFDAVKKGKIPVTKEIISLSLKAKDCIKNLLDDENYDKDAVIKNNLLDELSKISGSRSEIVTKETDEQNTINIAETKKDDSIEIFKILFKPSKEIFLQGLNLLPLFDELRLLGDVRISALVEDIPPFEDLNCEYCYINWIIVIATSGGIEAIKNAFIFAEYYAEVKISRIAENNENNGNRYKKIGEILLENELIEEIDFKTIMHEHKMFGEIALEKGILDRSSIESALDEQKFVKNIISEQKEKSENTTIRVKNEILDELLNLAGEFVTIQARLKQECLKQKDYEINVIAENLSRMTDSLRDISMQLRMIPFSVTFTNFKRLIHDLSMNLGKKINLTATGGNTEADKNIIDLLKDPLMHIIRNSADHGIEDPETRIKNGKSETGTIRLHAEQSGPNIMITVSDDGAGLNIDAIRKKAVELNLINKEETDEKKIINTIFLPGFSTAKQVTGVSGRGVGMDIVKKNIEKLKGTIDIESVPGMGSKAVITIPLTLAIVEGLLMTIGDNYFITNLSNVKECIDITKNKIKNENTGNVISIRGEIIPYVRLKELFETGIPPSNDEIMVITEYSGNKKGIIVDRVIGKCQAVIKPLSKIIKNYDYIFGASILGDGTVALILDLKKINESGSTVD